jgi:hypothetical protein
VLRGIVGGNVQAENLQLFILEERPGAGREILASSTNRDDQVRFRCNRIGR